MNLIGQRIGSYVVDRALGEGGTGAVYACRHTMIDREVAVKVLHDTHARDPDQVARFFQEAKAAADIGHPNIIVIIDYGTLITTDNEARTYLMMESLDGESLDKRIQRGGLSLADIAHILAQITSALIACHGKGVIHRDLKPSNIQLCNRTFDPLFVKVLDFGTAKLAAPSPDSHRTQYGVVIGTPGYMSPEQCEGKGAIDHRTDIYSLGIMLYEMLTGTLPFQGDLGQMLRGHLYTPPEPPSRRNPAIPPEWEALCLRMIEKQREDRFQSMTEVAHALEDLQGHAAAYEQRRMATPHHTLRMSAPGEDATRQTLHVDLGSMPPIAPPEITPSVMAPVVTPPVVTPAELAPPEPAAPATPPTADVSTELPAAESTPRLTFTSHDPRAACTSLVVDPRHHNFLRTLLARPSGRWFEVGELCTTATVAPPAALVDEGLYATWLEHPLPDPSLASIVFLALRTGWSTVVLTPRAR